MPPLLSVTAADIDSAGTTVERELPPDWLVAELADADAAAREPGHVTARLSRSGPDEIVVRGKATAKLTLPCARCLDPAPIDVEGELSLLLSPAPTADARHHGKKPHAAATKAANGADPARAKAFKAKPKEEEEYEFSAEEAEHDTYDGEVVVLDGFVREALLLELPNFPLCSETCPGIRRAPDDAADAPAPPVDPRLSPLAALRDRLPAAPAAPPKQASRPPKKKTKKE
jgi:uncharacterized protein